MRVLRSMLAMIVVLGVTIGLMSAPASATGDDAPQAEAAGLSSFTDVPDNHVFLDEIEFLAETGITTGYADGTFRPGQPVLREQMAAFLYRLETLYTGSEPEFSLPSSSPFVDVSPGHVFYRQIVWLAGTGITTGYADGTFRPGQPVLREQMAAFICRFDLGQPCADVSEDIGFDPFQVFVDVAPGHTFFDAIFVMFAAGISTGYEDGTYRPSQPVLREQMAAFLTRYINLWEASGTATKKSPEALIR